MALQGMFKANEYRQRVESLERENAALSARVQELEAATHPSAQALTQLEQRKAALAAEIAGANRTLQAAERACSERQGEIQRTYAQLRSLEAQIGQKRAELVTYDEELLIQEFGLYESRLPFAKSSEFKDRMNSLRAQQKAEVKKFNESLKQTPWTVNNNRAQGRKMVSDIGRLLMRAYNSDCDAIISKVKYSNIDRSIQQIRKSADTINGLGKVLGIAITPDYIAMKVFEARLAFEWARQKEKEKEELREARAREREERRLAQEIASERKKLEKEQRHYLNAYKEMSDRLANASDDERDELTQKVAELKGRLSDIDAAFANIDYREANQRAGYVYVISNIGSFGENVFKIGMTRRLNPMDRIRELGDASVPFNFDVHALMFSDDAPALEAALHREFESRKLNLVNQRREFFYCSLQEIKDVVNKNYDKTVEFVDVPDAEQFHISQKMRQRMLNNGV